MMHVDLFVLLQLSVACAKDEQVDKTSSDSETVLTDEDFKRAELIIYNETEEINDSEMYDSELFEGDIVGINSTLYGGENSFDHRRNRIARSAVRDRRRTWPGGIVYYYLAPSVFDKKERAEIAAAIWTIMSLTCIRFIGRTRQRNYVHIVRKDTCSSPIGLVGGRQELRLAKGCARKGIIMHEMMHCLGFYHEQGRQDRDLYVTIHEKNIKSGHSKHFQKYSEGEIDDLGTTYDYGSIMHYPSKAFSKNDKPTIEPKQKGVTIGQRIKLSNTDVLKIKLLYNCPSETTTQQTTTTTATTTTTQKTS